MKLIVFAPAWIGDMVMTDALVQVLARRQAETMGAEHWEIWLAAPKATAPVAARMANVSGVIELPFGHGGLDWRARRAFGHELRAHGFEWALVTQNSWKSALIPWFADIPRRTGWLGEQRYGLLSERRKLDPEAWPYMVQRLVGLADLGAATAPLLSECPVPRLNPDATNQAAVLTRLDLPPAGAAPVVALCPGAEFGPAKQWPAERFAELARMLCESDRQVWIFGGPKDRDIAQAIVGLTRGGTDTAPVVDLTGRTSLVDAIDLLGCVDQVVSNDSGLMHVAAALGRPVVGVYGSTSPGFTPPLGAQVATISLGLSCSPCFERTCPLGHTNCLTELAPEQVLEQFVERPAVLIP